jgi:GNAT superfamily N-acetyltransferase
VAAGWVEASEWDNLTSAWVGVTVRPDRRREGLGSQLLEALVGEATRRGRDTVGGWGWLGGPVEGFAAVHGFEVRSVVAQRRQVLAEVDWEQLDLLNAQAREHASGYELVRRVGPSPEADLPAIAALTASINDAPTDDLTWEDEAFPPERVGSYERVWQARGTVLHRLLARHRETGELAGHTVVVVDEERPWLAYQHDTAVAPSHRGHRLGLLLKTEMNRWLREEQPQVQRIDTENAESNSHMLAVNDAMGYRVVGREVLVQRP